MNANIPSFSATCVNDITSILSVQILLQFFIDQKIIDASGNTTELCDLIITHIHKIRLE